MSAFFIVMGETVQKKAIVITWNSLKTRNSLSGEFWVLSYDFLPCAYFSVTHGIMLGREGGKCVCFGLPSVKNVFEVLRFLK